MDVRNFASSFFQRKEDLENAKIPTSSVIGLPTQNQGNFINWHNTVYT